MKNLLFFINVVVLFLLTNCEKDISPLSESNSLTLNNEVDQLKGASLSRNFVVNINGPTNILLKGTSVTITGSIKDKLGKAIKNETIGVDDGLGLLCTTVRTDSKGNINYKTKVLSSGAASVVFIVRNERYSFIFQAASKKKGNIYYTNSLSISGLSINNKAKNNLKVIVSTYNKIQYIINLQKNIVQPIFKIASNEAIKRMTVYGGSTFSVGAGAGGEISVTVDSKGIATTTVTLGGGLYRGSVYVTSKNDLGGCWAPGGNLGVKPVSVSGEVSLCIGTDGINIGASGSLSGATGGFQINIVNW